MTLLSLHFAVLRLHLHMWPCSPFWAFELRSLGLHSKCLPARPSPPSLTSATISDLMLQSRAEIAFPTHLTICFCSAPSVLLASVDCGSVVRPLLTPHWFPLLAPLEDLRPCYIINAPHTVAPGCPGTQFLQPLRPFPYCSFDTESCFKSVQISLCREAFCGTTRIHEVHSFYPPLPGFTSRVPRYQLPGVLLEWALKNHASRCGIRSCPWC